LPLSAIIETLPVLVISPYSRCNCRCVMCDIWRGTEVQTLAEEELEHQLSTLRDLKIQWVVFSGGEPLMYPGIFKLCAIARERGARVTLLSTGLLLSRHADSIIEHVDDVIVSLDGPEKVHDRIRQVSGGYRTLAAGVARLREHREDYPVSGRCTVQRLNCHALVETIADARRAGLNSLSFLAADVHSTAFNRPGGLKILRQTEIVVGLEQLAVLESQIEAIISQGYAGGFVVESPGKLRRITHHFRCHWNLGEYEAPRCNAPWTSAVLEADGSVRPCFFHPAIATLKSGECLKDILNTPRAIEFRSNLDVPSNPICRRCVCALNWLNGAPAHIH
jgi:radical SAM protein with 4Fe4S-binding SPASM domain